MQELDTVKSELATERSKSSELGSQVAKMNQIISASQEALQQEQKTVELLKEAKVNYHTLPFKFRFPKYTVVGCIIFTFSWPSGDRFVLNFG